MRWIGVALGVCGRARSSHIVREGYHRDRPAASFCSDSASASASRLRSEVVEAPRRAVAVLQKLSLRVGLSQARIAVVIVVALPATRAVAEAVQVDLRAVYTTKVRGATAPLPSARFARG